MLAYGKRKRYIVLFFKTNHYSGQLKSSAEGEVFWIKRDALNQYKLASDFAEMVEIFERDDRSEFCYKRTKDGYKKEIYWFVYFAKTPGKFGQLAVFTGCFLLCDLGT